MAQTLETLNQEWASIIHSTAARRALMRWSAAHPVLLPATDLDGVLDLGYLADIGPEVRRVLAVMAPTDQLAARTLLQELLGGLVNLARRIGRDADAVDDVLAIAWERIRTYPSCRPGSVSGNVLLDVRKRYLRQHQLLCDNWTADHELPPKPSEVRKSNGSKTSSLPARRRACRMRCSRPSSAAACGVSPWRTSRPSSRSPSRCSGTVGGAPRRVCASCRWRADGNEPPLPRSQVRHRPSTARNRWLPLVPTSVRWCPVSSV